MDLEKEINDLIPNSDDNRIVDDPDADIFNNKKKKKKDNKLKKRSKDIFGFIDDMDDEIADKSLDYLIHAKSKGKDDTDDIFEVPKDKKDKDVNYETKFREEQSQLNKALKDSENILNEFKTIFDDLKSSRARGASKVLTDVMSNLNSANATRLQVIKEKSNLKKIIADLKLKQKSLKKQDEDELLNDNEQFAAKVLSDLYSKGGRVGAINAINEAYKDNYDPDKILVPDQVDEEGIDLDIDSDNSIDDIITQRVDKGSNRSDEVNTYIKYENMHPELCFIKNDESELGYELVALDGNGNKMPDDYPVPDIDTLGKLTFNYDSKIVTDANGRTYKLII